MSDMTIERFCDKHDACAEGRAWAIANCASMQDAWEKLKPEWLIWVATRTGVLTERELRLFAVWCARQVQHLMSDPRSVAAIDVAERHADGKATNAELAAARYVAWDVAWAAAFDAALASAVAWAGSAAAAAARDVARSAAWAAAGSAFAASYTARAVQADWLRKNCKPVFKEAKP